MRSIQSDCVLMSDLFLYLKCLSLFSFFFFFNDTATTEIYTLSLHDALPISVRLAPAARPSAPARVDASLREYRRSEEHTSELQSPCNLVCRLLLEKKKKNYKKSINSHQEIRAVKVDVDDYHRNHTTTRVASL